MSAAYRVDLSNLVNRIEPTLERAEDELGDSQREALVSIAVALTLQYPLQLAIAERLERLTEAVEKPAAEAHDQERDS